MSQSALQHRRYRDAAEFHQVEHAWAVAGWITLPISIIIVFAWIGVLLNAASKSAAGS